MAEPNVIHDINWLRAALEKIAGMGISRADPSISANRMRNLARAVLSAPQVEQPTKSPIQLPGGSEIKIEHVTPPGVESGSGRIANADLSIKPWPDPTPEMLDSPQFNAIWECIKTWDINVPGAYGGYCGATGNHVRAILDALNQGPVTAEGHECAAKDRYKELHERLTQKLLPWERRGPSASDIATDVLDELDRCGALAQPCPAPLSRNAYPIWQAERKRAVEICRLLWQQEVDSMAGNPPGSDFQFNDGWTQALEIAMRQIEGTEEAKSVAGSEDTALLDWLSDKLAYIMLSGPPMTTLPNRGKGWRDGELRDAIRAAIAQEKTR